MAMFIFAKAIVEGRPIRLFNYGRMRRDFTYVDDIVAAVECVIDKVPKNARRPRPVKTIL
jgi:UDP-glucuronate 4-epimerase